MKLQIKCVGCGKILNAQCLGQEILEGITLRGVPYLCGTCRGVRTWQEYEKEWLASNQNWRSPTDFAEMVGIGKSLIVDSVPEKPVVKCRWCKDTKVVTLLTTTVTCEECK